MAHNTNRPTHPARMSLADIEATWRVDGGAPLPECTYDPELHTGPRLTIESSEERAAREAVAREVCATCPALQFCQLYALESRPTSGIWAGQTPAQLADLAGDLEDLEVA
ncbi:WhiB family transcriptional regulator [Actinomadura sp. ATCC 31491]|uniref:WhiB family transcriptional regulator n=1 Tax=Actinomadura luzonensis TaxID=2805427 RepID=A0ABT0GBR7_9ACTN|nr:WhiB family transcriptional regulator [Actinomadura luzonensis]MCK2221924.1 WhiB family transcriptional regulator [Actinomadura luzonensis]